MLGQKVAARMVETEDEAAMKRGVRAVRLCRRTRLQRSRLLRRHLCLLQADDVPETLHSLTARFLLARETASREEVARAGVWGVPVVAAVHRIKWSCTSDACCNHTCHNHASFRYTSLVRSSSI